MTLLALTPQDLLSRSFHNIVFAGGGNRCWWQAGLVEALSQHACWQAKRLVGVSAGAGIATAFATGRIQNSLLNAIKRFDATPRNIEWGNLLKGKRPFVLPNIYPDWIASFLDAADLAKLKRQQLKVEVAITRPIPYLPLTLSTLVALALYSSEKYWLKGFHARLPHTLGFRAQYLDLTRSADLSEARTLLLASGAAVPITPMHQVQGRAALDGGFYDSVPLPLDRAEDANTLVLLTRHRPDLPQIFMQHLRVYLQPSKAVAAINMDCTSGTNVRLTYDQGQQEAMRLMA
jgi:predicted acylesterase/phospholipase RssA